MFDEENESNEEQLKAISIVPFLLIMGIAIIVLLVALYFMGSK